MLDQDGAVVTYNPQQPGRLSHIIHTQWIGNLRLVLDAQLQAGNRHNPSHGRTGLKALLLSLPAHERPKLVRGDSAYGSDGGMRQLEELRQPDLFKRRRKRRACRTKTSPSSLAQSSMGRFEVMSVACFS